jgi:hypothetical protein
MEVTIHCNAVPIGVDVFRQDQMYLMLIMAFLKLTLWRITQSAVSMCILVNIFLL